MFRAEKNDQKNTLNMKPIEKIAREHSDMLKQRENCGIGMIEKWTLCLAGRKDGKNGLPKMISDDVWMSVFMNKEYNALQERSSRLWGLQQSSLEPLYAEEGALLDRIRFNEARFKYFDNGRMEKRDPNAFKVRMSGEEHLSDDVINKRRRREAEKKDSEYREQKSALKAKIIEDYEKLIELSNRIDESNSSAMMCSQRFVEHAGQRMDVYWRAAGFVHPEKELFPAIPGMCFNDTEKDRYFETHQELTEAVRKAVKKYRTEIGHEDSACGQKELDHDII